MSAPAEVDPAALPPPALRGIEAGRRWWRVYYTSGPFPLPWNRFRSYGPADGRFDPHPLPPRVHPDSHAVLYLAETLTTALAEVFQRMRLVDRTFNNPYVVELSPARALRLLDLTGPWPLQAGYTAGELVAGRRDVARAWARAINARWPDLDCVYYRAKTDGGGCLALWAAARDAITHAAVHTNQPLNHPDLAERIADGCRSIGYRVL